MKISSSKGYGARRRWLRASPAVFAVIFLLIAVGALWATGIIDLAKLGLVQKPPDRTGQIPVPVSAGPIPAYTRITRDHLWNPRTATLTVLWLRPAEVPAEVLRNAGQIVGRVLDHDKPAGYMFTESDFLPVGTRAGIVGGIPAGKRAMRVLAEQVPGLIGLNSGDRFDLISALTISASTPSVGSGPYSAQLNLQASLTNWQKQATIRVIVQNGMIVEPMQTRQVPVVSNTMTSGMSVRNKPVQEVVIAVEPEEVSRLTEAIAVGAELQCVPRSGRPDDPQDSVTPDLTPWSPFGGTGGPTSGATSSESSSAGMGALSTGPLTTIETIKGTSRDLVATPLKH